MDEKIEINLFHKKLQLRPDPNCNNYYLVVFSDSVQPGMFDR